LAILSASLALACSGDHSRGASVAGAEKSPAVAVTTVTKGGVVTETLADGTTRTSRLTVGDVRSGADDPVNRSPVMNLKTTPEADDTTTPYPTILGSDPLTVKFNLCQSTDPDQNLEHPELGDRLNWQFNFGDGPPPFDADGSFHPDYEHFCRVEHTYGVGRYIATVSVTDRHLNDQSSGGVRALARVSKTLSIVVLGPAPAAPLPSCPFTDAASSQWVSDSSTQTLTCTCPSNGQVLPFFPPAPSFATSCFGQGFNGAIAFTPGKCGCF
jgi:hypothetical protein